MKEAGKSWKEQWERMGRRGGEEEEENEEGRVSHARLCFCTFGPLQQRVGEGGKGCFLLLLTTSGPGSPSHSHKDMISQLLPPANYLKGEK